jgi:3-deoxy-7-phosphoheptulonate synthase
MKKTWSPKDWRSLPALHIPDDYPDAQALNAVESELSHLPPLVFAGEARRLSSARGQVAEGNCFQLQGCDGAETVNEF